MSESGLSAAKQVLTAPAQFYSAMPVSGGFVPPALYIVAVALITALALAIVELFVSGFAPAISQMLQALVALPVYGLFICLVRRWYFLQLR